MIDMVSRYVFKRVFLWDTMYKMATNSHTVMLLDVPFAVGLG